MTMQTELVTLLSDVTSGKVYPLAAPDEVAAPYLTYSRISALEQVSLSGPNALTNTRIQIDVWAATYADAVAKAAAVRVAMAGWANKNVKISEVDFYEPDTRLHRISLDFSIWHH